MTDVTRILSAIEQGDPQAAEQLLPLVYDELRKLAAQKLAQEKPGQTLQATALVHEAYLRLVGSEPRPATGTAAATSSPRPPRPCAASSSRTPAASGRPKHGGERQRVDLDEAGARRTRRRAEDLLALDEALTRLAAEDPGKAELVKLRFFAGLTIERGRRGPRHLAAHRRPLLGLRPGLAAPRGRAATRAGPAAEKFFVRTRERTPAPILALAVEAAESRTQVGRRHADDPSAKRSSSRPWSCRVADERAAFLDGPAAATRSCGGGSRRCSAPTTQAGSFLRAPAPVRRCRRRGSARPPSESRHGRSARTSCWSRSARAAWAPSTWPSRPSPSAARWP